MKTIDYVIIAVLVLWLIKAIIFSVRKKKNGCNGCNGSCDGCSLKENCENNKKSDE